MSGWTKVEKDLVDSIKFRRFARKFEQSPSREDWLRNASRNASQTLLLGGLLRLWIYADSHIADDNTISANLDEIDELVGIAGFAQALPADWLKVIDADHVQLPDFVESNGTSAKQRKDAAKRQAAYRQRLQSAEVTHSNASRNGSNAARPDQTRLIKSARPPLNGGAPNTLPGGVVLTPADLRRLKPEVEPGNPRFPLKAATVGARARKVSEGSGT